MSVPIDIFKKTNKQWEDYEYCKQRLKENPENIKYIKMKNKKELNNFLQIIIKERIIETPQVILRYFNEKDLYSSTILLIIISSSLSNEIIFFMNNIKNKQKLIKIISHSPLYIKYIENPSEEVQLAAVKEDPYVIRFIKNPTENVKLQAVKQSPFLFNRIY